MPETFREVQLRGRLESTIARLEWAIMDMERADLPTQVYKDHVEWARSVLVKESVE